MTKNFKKNIFNYYQFFNELIIAAYGIVLIISLVPKSNLSSYSASETCINLIIAAWGLSMLCNLIISISNICIKIKNLIAKLRAKRKERTYRMQTSPENDFTFKDSS